MGSCESVPSVIGTQGSLSYILWNVNRIHIYGTYDHTSYSTYRNIGEIYPINRFDHCATQRRRDIVAACNAICHEPYYRPHYAWFGMCTLVDQIIECILRKIDLKVDFIAQCKVVFRDPSVPQSFFDLVDDLMHYAQTPENMRYVDITRYETHFLHSPATCNDCFTWPSRLYFLYCWLINSHACVLWNRSMVVEAREWYGKLDSLQKNYDTTKFDRDGLTYNNFVRGDILDCDAKIEDWKSTLGHFSVKNNQVSVLDAPKLCPLTHKQLTYYADAIVATMEEKDATIHLIPILKSHIQLIRFTTLHMRLIKLLVAASDYQNAIEQVSMTIQHREQVDTVTLRSAFELRSTLYSRLGRVQEAEKDDEAAMWLSGDRMMIKDHGVINDHGVIKDHKVNIPGGLSVNE